MPSTFPPTRETPPRPRAAPADVTIVDWPLRDQPLASSLALSIAAGAVWLAVWATGNPWIGVLVAVLLAATLWRTWLPVQYQLGAAGVEQKVLGFSQRITWNAIQNFELRSDGVVLLFDAQVTALSPLRGVYMHWASERDAVLAQLDYYAPGRNVVR